MSERKKEVIEIDPGALSGIFAAPKWMRDLGFSAWLLVGVGIVASVVSPAVDWLHRRGVPRAIGATLVFVLIALIGFGIGLMVMSGIASEASSLSAHLREGAREIESLLRDLGVKAGTAAGANSDTSASVSTAFAALTQ